MENSSIELSFLQVLSYGRSTFKTNHDRVYALFILCGPIEENLLSRTFLIIRVEEKKNPHETTCAQVKVEQNPHTAHLPTMR